MGSSRWSWAHRGHQKMRLFGNKGASRHIQGLPLYIYIFTHFFVADSCLTFQYGRAGGACCLEFGVREIQQVRCVLPTFSKAGNLGTSGLVGGSPVHVVQGLALGFEHHEVAGTPRPPVLSPAPGGALSSPQKGSASESLSLWCLVSLPAWDAFWPETPPPPQGGA